MAIQELITQCYERVKLANPLRRVVTRRQGVACGSHILMDTKIIITDAYLLVDWSAEMRYRFLPPKLVTSRMPVSRCLACPQWEAHALSMTEVGL